MSLTRKLVVLDLNGTLVYRYTNKKVFPRAYLSTFTSFLFHPETTKWLDVMVWSSSQPQNVTPVVASAFGQHASQLKGVWTRNDMGLPSRESSRRAVTRKDLERVWAAFPAHNPGTTLLVDDNPSKAHFQPSNHICLPENPSPAPPRRKAALPADDDPRVESDQVLLAIIGILEKAKDETHLATWVADGGLFLNRPISDILRREAAVREFPARAMWFLDDGILEEWIEQGKTALQRLDIGTPADIHDPPLPLRL
ncbi:hypothetical protein BDZ89DRAFT_1069195, partial [Hymenopellis radicata]